MDGRITMGKGKESPLSVRKRLHRPGATQQFIMHHNLLRRSMEVFSIGDASKGCI